MRTKNRNVWLVCTAVAAASQLASCASVPAYRRGRLLSPAMQAKPALDGAFDGHVQELRESIVGAAVGQDASCGCR